MFLILSAATGLLECSLILHGFHMQLEPWQILCFPLAYQGGNLFPVPFSLSSRQIHFLTWTALGLLLISAGFGQALSYPICLAEVFLLSAGLQSVRFSKKSDGNRIKKRLSRVAGFALSPMFAGCPAILFLICGLLILYADKERRIAGQKFLPPSIHGISSYMVMLLHQIHYFVYAYGMILLSLNVTGNMVFTMMVFAGTWIAYLSAEPFCRRYIRAGNFTIFLSGHILLILLLTGLFFSHSPAGTCFFWITAGLGGGTVFAITGMIREQHCYDKYAMALTENLGHITGVCIAVLWLFFLPDGIRFLPLIAALFAGAAIGTALYINRGSAKSDRKELS